jgi:hypothetical protein
MTTRLRFWTGFAASIALLSAPAAARAQDAQPPADKGIVIFAGIDNSS